MSGVILGLPGPWADDNLELADHYTTKIGGLSDWPFLESLLGPELLECVSCKSKLCLILQVYAPIYDSAVKIEERVLYVFGCSNPPCESWRAIRVQKPGLVELEAAPSIVASTASDFKSLDDKYSFEAKLDDDDDDDDDIDMEELSKALFEAANIASKSVKEDVKKNTETTAKPPSLQPKARKVDPDTLVLPCFYIYSQEDIASQDSVAYPSPSLKEAQFYKDNNEPMQEESWEEEGYEYDKALNADRTFLKFKKRLDKCPEQCFRYSFGGKPLFVTGDVSDPGSCSLCGEPRHYEMQLMSPLVYFLQERSIGKQKDLLENWNWMTLFVHTCSKVFSSFVWVWLMAYDAGGCSTQPPIEFNPPVSRSSNPPDAFRQQREVESTSAGVFVSKRKRKDNASPCIDGSVQGFPRSRGSAVKASGLVLHVRSRAKRRRANVICRVESFGKIVSSFDDRRKKWVHEMGFGGLLFLVDRHLPRDLCYWLMTRLDPFNEMLDVGGKQYRLSPVQVRWVLGLPRGELEVPFVYPSEEALNKVSDLQCRYGSVWTSYEGISCKAVIRKGFSMSEAVAVRLMSDFDDSEVDEFKMLFLFASLYLVLCPTQSARFCKDLIPCLGCAPSSRRYNWCALVLRKLMESARRFSKRFHAEGYAGGCGGCTLFLAIYYMDRLNRNALLWGSRPRIKVWTDDEMKKACKCDRLGSDGDFGAAGVIDVAYGENHPRDARDVDFLSDDDEDEL